jgi:hypothetical protein
MLVIFRRTGERRYGVEVRRPRFGDVEKSPAPGFDELMPHDLMHLVVEAELGLKRGIFGQLEAGGHAGTFRDYLQPATSVREAARRRRHADQRSAGLLREGRNDCAQSERATYICCYAWLSRSREKDRQKVAQAMIQNAKHVRSIAAANESQVCLRRRLRRSASSLIN